MTKKIAILCTILALFAGRLHAQQNTPQPSPELNETDYIEKIEKYRRMRTGGAIITVVGSVLVVAGVITMYNSIDETFYLDDSGIQKGTVCALFGYAALGTGIPLWIVGGVQHKKYTTKLQQFTVKINATPQTQGLTLTYRF